MHFVTLIFFSILWSFAIGAGDGVGPYYDEMKADDAINDFEQDDTTQTLSGDDDRNEGIEDDDEQLDRTIDAIKTSVGNDGVDDSDGDNKKLNAGNIGIDDGDETVLDGTDNPSAGIKQNVGSDNGNDVIGNKKLNRGNIGIYESDESVLNANDKKDRSDSWKRPLYNKNEPSMLLKLNSGNDELDVKQYQLELAAGDLSELLGNAHHHGQRYYKDLSRRFVPVYPYEKRKVKKHRKLNPEEIIRFILARSNYNMDVKTPKRTLRDKEERDIVPIRAPPELVLAAMKNGTKRYASKPSEPTEEVIRQYMLRSGNYWDNVWKEEVVPRGGLRTKKHHKQSSDSQPITAKLVPGTKLYDLLARIVKKTPKLVYIINS